MKHFVYLIKDKVSNSVVDILFSVNDAMAIRSSLPSVSRRIPVSDIEYYCISESFDTESMCLDLLDSPRFVPQDSYKFPETQTDSFKKD